MKTGAPQEVCTADAVVGAVLMPGRPCHSRIDAARSELAL